MMATLSEARVLCWPREEVSRDGRHAEESRNPTLLLQISSTYPQFHKLWFLDLWICSLEIQTLKQSVEDGDCRVCKNFPRLSADASVAIGFQLFKHLKYFHINAMDVFCAHTHESEVCDDEKKAFSKLPLLPPRAFVVRHTPSLRLKRVCGAVSGWCTSPTPTRLSSSDNQYGSPTPSTQLASSCVGL